MVDSTIAYYNRNAFDFYNNTVNADMSEHYKKFERYLSPGGRILDAGCGSGRDSLYFLNRKFKVDAFDASKEMVKLSSELTKLPVQLATFENIKLNGIFDGIWACASLLHIGREALPSIIKKLSNALKKDGVFFMSFKYGDKLYEKEGRVFNCYDKNSFEDLIKSISCLSIIELYRTADARVGRADEYWLSAILKKS